MPKDAKPARKPNPALMRPVQPTPVLARVIGDEAVPRSEVTKRVWAYIKKHQLQDPEKKNMINADEALKQVFEGRAQVSMFEMSKFINANLKAQ